MFWMAIPLIMSAIDGVNAGTARRAQTEADNTVNEANTLASNLVRTANNELKGARSSLARYTQSVNNQRTLENSASAAEAAQINYRRSRDSSIVDDVEAQIGFAEQAGAQAAATALSGLSGGVADIVAGTTALRKARIQQRQAEATKGMDYDAAQRNKNILQAGWDSLDHSEIAADIDFSNEVAIQKPVSGSWLLDAFGGQSSQNLSGAANVFGSFFKSSPNAATTIPMQPGGGQ